MTCPERIYLNAHLSPHIIYLDVRNDPRPVPLRSIGRTIKKECDVSHDSPCTSKPHMRRENGHSLNGSASPTQKHREAAIADRLRCLGLLERQVQEHVAHLSKRKRG